MNKNLKTTLPSNFCLYNQFLYFQKYYHGESIAVNVLVDNNTSKTVKKVKLSGESAHSIGTPSTHQQTAI